MDINTIVLVVILLVIVYAMFTNGKEKNSLAAIEREQSIAEKEDLSNEEMATYGQVQERKKQLFDVMRDDIGNPYYDFEFLSIPRGQIGV